MSIADKTITANISSGEIDGRIGSALRLLDVYIKLDRVANKVKTDAIKTEHGSVSKYLQSLFDRYGVNEFYINVYKANGTSHQLTEKLCVSNNNSISGTTEVLPATIQTDTDKPAINQIKKPQQMENTQAGFYALQAEFLRNQYEALKTDYESLKRKFDLNDDELRAAKTKISIADVAKDHAVLSGVMEAKSSGMDFFKEVMHPANADGIAKLINAVKGQSGEGSSTPAIFNGMNQVQKDSISALADLVKLQTPEETEAMVATTIIASKEASKTWFQRVRSELEATIPQ